MPFPLATKAGMSMASADVCKVPAGPVQVPTSFTNVANHMAAVTNTSTILIDNAPAINLGSVVPTSSGDEAGVTGGVVSATIMGPCMFTKGSSLVMMNGLPAVFLTGTTTQNHANAVGMVTDAGQSLATTES